MFPLKFCGSSAVLLVELCCLLGSDVVYLAVARKMSMQMGR